MEFGETIERAKSFFRQGKTRDIIWRQNQLRALCLMIEENKHRIRTVLRNDLNKVDYEVEIECTSVITEAAEAIDNIKYWTRPECIPGDMSSKMSSMKILPQSRGTCIIIGPWNFPINCLLRPLVSAISAGCTAVLKPSEISISTCRLLMEIIPLYLDKDAYPVIFADGPQTASILEIHRFDLVFFTGSSVIGKMVYQAAASHLSPVILELGGKNPVWIDETVDLTTTAKRVLWGRCTNTGQLCLAPDYVLLPEKLKSNFVKSLHQACSEMYGCSPELSESYSGKIINKKHFDRITQLLSATNGNIVMGGKNDPTKFYIEPTVVTNVTEKDSLMQEEIFGPILSLVSCESFSDAIEFINSRETPLAAYCFSKDKYTKNRFEAEVRCGGTTINDILLHVSNSGLPFGGFGHSGIGSYHGYHGFRSFSHMKSIYKQLAPEFVMKMLRPPYSETKLKIFNLFKKKNPRPSWQPNIKLPVVLDYLLMFVLYGLMIALVVRVLASDHLQFQNPFLIH